VEAPGADVKVTPDSLRTKRYFIAAMDKQYFENNIFILNIKNSISLYSKNTLNSRLSNSMPLISRKAEVHLKMFYRLILALMV